MTSNTCPVLGAPVTLGDVWRDYLEHARVDPVTVRSYSTTWTSRLEPVLGQRPVSAVTAGDVQGVLDTVRAAGHSVTSAKHCWVLLSLLLRRAAVLGLVDEPATRSVPMPRPPVTTSRVMTPDEFLRVQRELPTPGARLLADLLVRSGVRLGEAFALRVGSVDGDSLHVDRSLSEPGRRLSPGGQRFLVRSTKTGVSRRVAVGEAVAEGLRLWSGQHSLGPDDLLFPARLVLPPPSGRSFPTRIYQEPLTPERVAELGTFTGPNGLTYQHGTVNGYTSGRCRQACCRQAVSEYSAMRRKARAVAAGRAPRALVPAPTDVRRPQGPGDPAVCEAAGALTRQSWRAVWVESVRRAGLDFTPLPRQTRHAHASWLNGAGLAVEGIAARLGHCDERSTRAYLRPVGSEPEAVDVMDALLGHLPGTT